MKIHYLRLTLFIGLLFIFTGFSRAFSKSFSLDKIEINARIQADGHLQIQENRTYSFEGSFSWADYRLPLQGISDIRYFSLGDESETYRRDTSEEPGTYSIQEDAGEFYVRWFYRAKNESRTFTLNYLATDAITTYQDVAELYFKFVGAANDFPVQTVEVTIEYPFPAGYPEVRAWAHGPLWGEVGFQNDNLILSVSPLPAHRYWEVRTVFPPEWVPGAARTLAEIHLPTVLDEEDLWARQANEEREKAQRRLEQRKEREEQAWNYAVAACLLGLLGMLFLYLRYGKGHRVDFHQKVSSDIPRDEPPAFTSLLFFNKQVYGAAMTATLLDLARRGYLAIEQTTLPESKWWGTKRPQFTLIQKSPEQIKKPLLDFEQDLLDFTFHELGEGRGTVDFKTFTKNRSTVQRWFGRWKKKVLAHQQDLVYYDKASVKGTIIATVLSALIIIAGILIMIGLGTPGILAIIVGSALLGISFTLLSYTPEIKLRRKKLQALKNYLRNYHFMQTGSSQSAIENIDLFLIYGMALGLGKKQIEKMMLTVPAGQQHGYFPWYHYPHGGYASPMEFATAVSTMVSIASSTVSSSTGSGGGASGGGGGGGGGASGGAG